jgi:chromatin structure-remodeling complex subunit RSC1/2
MNVARTPAPKHSIAYLHFLAEKRKLERDGEEERMDIDNDDGDGRESKRKKMKNVGLATKTRMPPTASETFVQVLAEFGKGDGVPV